MRIASNKLSDLHTFYKNELTPIYEPNEINSIFELVCDYYLQYNKTTIKQRINENINQSDLIKIYNTCLELKTGIPIHYILNEAYFFDSKFMVNKDVLIPRPETEELVDIILKTLKENNQSNITILDIGTGSGCIPIILKKHLPLAKVFGIDVSKKALTVANKNSSNLKQEVHFSEINILTEGLGDAKYSVLVSNPPYVLKSEAIQMENHVLLHEPHLALFVEDTDPIIFYKRIIDLCEKNLEEKGWLFFELNPLYCNEVSNYAITSKLFIFSEILKDMSGKQRFFKAQKK